MSTLVEVVPQRVRAAGWAAWFPVVMLVTTMYWGVRPWTVTVVLAAVAVVLLAPVLAADLVPVALIGFAACAFALAQRGGTMPPGSGTTRGYLFHGLLFTRAMPNFFDLSAGLVMLAFGFLTLERRRARRGRSRPGKKGGAGPR